MNVYITHEKDGFGGEQVEKVFLTEESAQDHIIKTRFKGSSAYGKLKHELEEAALVYIEPHITS
jgi:hypothetical protein